MILFESKHGKDLAGNIYRLLEKLQENYRGKYKVYLSYSSEKYGRISNMLKNGNIPDVNLVSVKSVKYYKLLSTAKYLITDTSFTTRYIKKQGQIVVNTWHGTPLKMMGRDIEDSIYSMGNVERNLLFSDYLIYPNEYMKEKMVSAYMLDGVFKGKILNEGYPRNCIFFDAEKGERIKKLLNLSDKQVFVYMPTWRGNLAKMENDRQIEILSGYLSELDKRLGEDQVVMTKLHPFVGADFDYSGYKHIIPMPDMYESYELLNCADCLITDYSSVFYDFANTGRKIILFIYDEEEYMSQRGVYMPLESLPFPKTYNIDELYGEMCRPKNYDDSEFMKYCCTYENPNAAERILSHILEGKQVCSEESIKDDSKENVLIFTGVLAKNGITTAAHNLFEYLDTDKRRYYATFQETEIRHDPMRAAAISHKIRVLPMSTKPQYTLTEAAAQVLYYKLNVGIKPVIRLIDRMCQRDIERFFGGIDFSSVVQYEGYGKNMIHLFAGFSCNTVIMVHNNMQEELASKDNQHRMSLERAYNRYDKVACVTKDLVESTAEISHNRDNIYVVNNCHAYESIRQRAQEEVRFNEDTESNAEYEKLMAVLESDNMKIINISRFSYEKGHDILIEAFEKYAAENPKAYLIIIGGYGKLHQNTLEMAERSSASDRIIIIKSMRNPMPILKKCSLFILSSRYEGLGLTLLEADALGIPTVSTNVCGPSGFMKEHGGYLAEPSAEGIYKSMKDFEAGRIRAMNVDYREYNEKAALEFENLLRTHTGGACP